MTKRNPDERMRELQRRAALGDADAAAQLEALQARTFSREERLAHELTTLGYPARVADLGDGQLAVVGDMDGRRFLILNQPYGPAWYEQVPDRYREGTQCLFWIGTAASPASAIARMIACHCSTHPDPACLVHGDRPTRSDQPNPGQPPPGPGDPSWDPTSWLAAKMTRVRKARRAPMTTEEIEQEQRTMSASAAFEQRRRAEEATRSAHQATFPPRRICLVSCSGPKLPHPAPARDLYTSRLFKKARAYAERRCDDWAILSALHGLVLPDQVIAPYDCRLPGRQDELAMWGNRVGLQIGQAFRPQDRFVILAGADYADALPREIRVRSEQPLRGVHPVGRRERWLTENPEEKLGFQINPGARQGPCSECGKDLGPYRGFGVPKVVCGRKCTGRRRRRLDPTFQRKKHERWKAQKPTGKVCRACGVTDSVQRFKYADLCLVCEKQLERAKKAGREPCPKCGRSTYAETGVHGWMSRRFCSYCPGVGKTLPVAIVAPGGKEERIAYLPASFVAVLSAARGGIAHDEMVLEMPTRRAYATGSLASVRIASAMSMEMKQGGAKMSRRAKTRKGPEPKKLPRKPKRLPWPASACTACSTPLRAHERWIGLCYSCSTPRRRRIP